MLDCESYYAKENLIASNCINFFNLMAVSLELAKNHETSKCRAAYVLREVYKIPLTTYLWRYVT